MSRFKSFHALEDWEKVVLSKGGTANGLFKIEGELLPEEPDIEEDFDLGIYRAYVHNSDNIRKCEHCPYNKYNTYCGCGENECLIEQNCNEDYDSEILEIVIEDEGCDLHYGTADDVRSKCYAQLEDWWISIGEMD